MTETDPYVELSLVPGAEVCFIHFSSRGKKAGKFHRYPTPAGASNIFVNCAGDRWYLDGIPGWGDVEQSAGNLRERTVGSGARQIVCIGSSMGAWGAALYASQLGCELVCFGPELWLHVYSGFSREDLQPTDTRLLPVERGPSRALIVCGVGSPSDIACAQHFATRWSNVTLVYLRQCGHETARRLRDTDTLPGLIARFASGQDQPDFGPDAFPVGDIAAIGPPAPAELSRETLSRFVEALSARLMVAEQMLVAHHLVARRMFHDAIPVLERMLADHGRIPELILMLATCLRKAKRYPAALSLLAEIETAALLRQQALWLKAQIKEAAGSTAEAATLYRTLLAEHEKNAIVAAAAQKLKTVAAVCAVVAPAWLATLESGLTLL